LVLIPAKILKEGASNYTMRRFYDVAKEEFEKLEKLREVGAWCMLKLLRFGYINPRMITVCMRMV